MDAERRTPPDELRRRLYAPGASAQDLAAYRALVGDDPDPGEPTPPAPPPPPTRRVRRRVLVVGGVIGAAALAGVLLTRPARVAEPTDATASPLATPEPTPTLLPLPRAAGPGFVRALGAGEDAGLLPYFFDHPEDLPPAIRTVSRSDSAEYHGTGTDELRLDPSALADGGGRFTVLLVADRLTKFEWHATRGVVPTSIAARYGELPAGALATETVPYTGGAPTDLLLLVPEGVGWGVAVVYTD